MIISEIIGGLGNQMFQYAAGWALARDKSDNLKLDISAFTSYPLHQGFEIAKVFTASVEIATLAEIKAVLGWQYNQLAKRALSRAYLAPLRKATLLVEPHFHYFDAARAVKGDAYLRGYWQSERHFQAHDGEIRHAFQFKQTPSMQNQVWINQIKSCKSASIHIRRGDFISKKNVSIHGVCTMEYFTLAVQYVLERIPDVEFFIFSDDMRWVKENLKFNSPCHFVENNKGIESFNDMRLMALCNHNIIANSSFSWWGAWLNANVNKIVIAPKKWFASEINTNDLLPDAWIDL